MNDQLFAKDWNDGHERFSADVDKAVHAAGRTLRRRLDGLSDTAKHGLMMVAAVIASATTLALATPAGAAQAPIEVVAPSVTVSYADLDLRTAAGRQALDDRARQAARQLCQPDLAGVTVERLERRTCYRAAIAGAARQADVAAIAFAENRAFGARAVTVTAR